MDHFKKELPSALLNAKPGTMQVVGGGGIMEKDLSTVVQRRELGQTSFTVLYLCSNLITNNTTRKISFRVKQPTGEFLQRHDCCLKYLPTNLPLIYS